MLIFPVYILQLQNYKDEVILMELNDFEKNQIEGLIMKVAELLKN